MPSSNPALPSLSHCNVRNRSLLHLIKLSPSLRASALLPRELGKNHSRFVDPPSGQRMQARVDMYSDSNIGTNTLSCQKPKRSSDHYRGGDQAAGETSHSSGQAIQGAVPEQVIHCTKTRRIISTCNKPETLKLLDSQAALQDGRNPDCQEPAQAGRLDGLHRSNGCLPVSVYGRSTQEVPTFSMGGPAIRVPVPPFRSVQCSKNLYKITQTCDGPGKDARSAIDRLLGRHSAARAVERGPIISSNSDDQVTRAAGICDQSGEVTPSTNADNTVSGVHHKLSIDDNQFATREGGTDQAGLSMGSLSTNDISEGSVSYHRTTDGFHPSSVPSPLTIQIPTEAEESVLLKDPRLRCTRVPGPGVERRAYLVDDQHRLLEWQEDHTSTTRHDHRDRCIPSRMGSGEGRSVHERPVVCPREKPPHQHPRAEGRDLCSEDLCLVNERHPCPTAHGQQNGSVLYQQDGGNQITPLSSTSLSTMAMVSPERYINLGRVPSRSRQLHSRPTISPSPVISRMEAEQTGLPSCDQGIGEVQHRSVRNTLEPPAHTVCQLETRSLCNSHRCNDNQLERQGSICFSTVLPDSKMLTESGGGEGNADIHSASMEHSAMVPSSPESTNRSPPPTATKTRSLDRPVQSILPTERPAVSRLENIRRQHSNLGLSEGASNLIQAGWSKGTNTAYQSAWSKWVSWCDKRKDDPLRCGIHSFVDFLADCFQKGLQHRTINLLRSAVSMTHEHVEGIPLNWDSTHWSPGS